MKVSRFNAVTYNAEMDKAWEFLGFEGSNPNHVPIPATPEQKEKARKKRMKKKKKEAKKLKKQRIMRKLKEKQSAK